MTEEQNIDNMFMEQIEKDCFVDTTETISYPPVALSLGKHTINTSSGLKTYPIPIGTYGNFSFVQAPPKTKKTFFISLLASVYLSGKNRFGGEIQGHKEDRCLIHFDTEQGKWHSQRVFSHIITVIHSNFGSSKPTGHLGSLLEKKCESQIELELNTVHTEQVTVKCKRSRGYSFDTFSFKVNDIGLPEVIGNVYDHLEGIGIKYKKI